MFSHRKHHLNQQLYRICCKSMAESDLYFFLSSRDSLFYHKDNKPYDFTVELNETVNLKGLWEIVLCDINLNTNLTESVYVYSDICDQSYVLNSSEPVIRLIFPSASSTSYSFTNRYYLPIKQKVLTRIRVYIRDNEMNSVSSLSEEIQLTLHARLKKWIPI